MKKVCTECHQQKLLSEFYKNKQHKDGLRSRCKTCETLRHKKYVKSHREKINKINKKWRDAHIDKVRAKDRKRSRARYKPIGRLKIIGDKKIYQAELARYIAKHLRENTKLINEWIKKDYRERLENQRAKERACRERAKDKNKIYQAGYYKKVTKIKRQQKKMGAAA